MANLYDDNFNTLFLNKIEFMDRIINDADIAKCLCCNDKNFKDYSPTIDETEGLAWNNVLPCYAGIETQQETKSYITMKFRYDRHKKSNVWKIGFVTFYIYCHKSIVRTDYGILRYDYLLQKINELMFRSKGQTWLGNMDFDGMEDIIVDEKGDYIGVAVRYKSVEQM